MASLTCLAAARHRAAAADGWDVRARGIAGIPRPLVLYLSEEGHSCMRKAAEVLGLGAEAVRTVPVDAGFRMDVGRSAPPSPRTARPGVAPSAWRRARGRSTRGRSTRWTRWPTSARPRALAPRRWRLRRDRRRGPALAPRYAGLERADSLALDPHKWLSVPVECGCALVRDGRLLRDAWSLVPLSPHRGRQGLRGLPWYSEYGFQQTRGFRALKLWMILQHLGRDGVAALVRRHVTLAQPPRVGRRCRVRPRARSARRSYRSCASASCRGCGPGTRRGSTP